MSHAASGLNDIIYAFLSASSSPPTLHTCVLLESLPVQLHVLGAPVWLDQAPPMKQPLLLKPFRSMQALLHASAFAHAACGPQMD
jgi:hypothetical protein